MVDKLNKQSAGKNGGKRSGAGRKKGSLSKKTKEKLVVEEEFRQRVLKSMNKIMDSQMNLAQGCQFLFKIETYSYKDKHGNWRTEKKKPELVKSSTEIKNYLAGDYEDDEDVYYFLTTQKPDNKALDSLIDRVFGKAVHNVDIKSGGETISDILNKIAKKNDG